VKIPAWREGKPRREGPDLPYLPRHDVRPSKNKLCFPSRFQEPVPHSLPEHFPEHFPEHAPLVPLPRVRATCVRARSVRFPCSAATHAPVRHDALCPAASYATADDSHELHLPQHQQRPELRRRRRLNRRSWQHAGMGICRPLQKRSTFPRSQAPHLLPHQRALLSSSPRRLRSASPFRDAFRTPFLKRKSVQPTQA